MSRFTKYLAVLSFLPVNAYSQDYDIKKAYWGMSPLEVQISEGKPPDYEGNNAGSKYFQHWYYIRTGPNQWYPRIADWRYYFRRNKLVKVYFRTSWKGNVEKSYNNELRSYTKRAGKDPKQVDTERSRSHQWTIDNRTFVRMYLAKQPSANGKYLFEAWFYDAEYKKEQEANR